MNCLRRFFVNQHTDLYRNIPLVLATIPTKLHYSARSQVLSNTNRTSQTPTKNDNEQHYLDIVLDNIPSPWSKKQSKDNSDTTDVFKQWIKLRNLSEEDGHMLIRLKEHIMNGGHPDFPRLTKNENNEKCLKHWTDDYFTSIDKECFQWIKKQKQLYKDKTIHPYIHWKLLQLNVTLKWTRQPLQDRDFRWIGYHDDVLNHANTAELVAESDPLFPLHSKDEPLLKFLNPFYELWHETMPQTLKQLRLINANKEPKNESYIDKDDIRGTRIIKRFDVETNEWKYYIGPKDIDQQKIDDEILCNTDKTETETETKTETETEKHPMIRTAYLSKNSYDKNSYNFDELNVFYKEAPNRPTDEIPIEAMNHRREKETKKELKQSFDSAKAKPIYSKKQRAEYYIEALKRDLIEASHLNLDELILIIQYLGLEYHKKQNPNAKKMNPWSEYPAGIKREEIKTKWNNWNGNKPVEIFEFKPQRYTDVNGIFSELDIYYQTKHPGQPPWSVWDIPQPNFDVEYLQIKVESYIKCWSESFEGKNFIKNKLQKRFDKNNKNDIEMCNKLNKGIELLSLEKAIKYDKINDNKQFRYKFGNDPLWTEQCKDTTLEIQTLQYECQQIDRIINRVCLYNDIVEH